LGPLGGFCEGLRAGVEGVEVMEATSGAIGEVTTRGGAAFTCLWGCERRAWAGLADGVSVTRGHVLGHSNISVNCMTFFASVVRLLHQFVLYDLSVYVISDVSALRS
jgi:hypothetical protein